MAVIEKVQLRRVSRGKIYVTALLVTVLIAIIAVVSISIYVGMNLTEPERKVITQLPSDYELLFEDVEFISEKDDLILSGWWIPAQNDRMITESLKSVIFAHGYGDVRTQEKISVLQLAQRFTKEGYNVLLFDFRASGKSEGNRSTIGQFEKDDLLAAVTFAKEEKKSEELSVIGWSMGAVAAILAAVESDDINVVIADSPFADLKEYLEENLPYWSGLPSFPFTPVIINIIPYLAGIDAKQVSPDQAVKELDENRLLLIHSKEDAAIPYSNSERILKSANSNNATLWLTDEGGHIESFLTDREKYEEQVLSFIKNQ